MLPTFSPTSCISFQEPPHQLRCTCRVRALYVSTGSVSNVTLQSSRRHPRHVTLNCELPCTLETGTHLCVRTNKLFSAVVIPFGATFRSGRWVRCFAAVYKERRDWTMGARALPPPPPPPPHGFTLPGGWDDKASPRCDWCVRFARTFFPPFLRRLVLLPTLHNGKSIFGERHGQMRQRRRIRRISIF